MSDNPKGWLKSDIYDRARDAGNLPPRTSVLRFGSFGDALGALGKLIGQSLMSWFLFAMLFIVLVEAGTEHNDQYYLAANEIVKLICFTISVFLAARIFDDLDIKDIGLTLNRLALRDLVAGFGVVAVLFTLRFVFDLATGAIQVTSTAWESQPADGVFWNVVITLLIFLFVGWSEELLSRGYHLRIFSKGLNRPLGIVISSAIFAYLHHNNPDVTPMTYIFLFLVGLLMSVAFLRSGTLWLPMGLHAGWDFFVAGFWGAPISGLRIFHLMDIRIVPGIALTGLLREMIELGLLAAFVYFYTRRRKPEIVDF